MIDPKAARTVWQVLDRGTSWAILAIGVTHCLLTPILFRELTPRAVWFFSGGLAIVYQALFNLLRLRHGRVAGIRRLSIGANLAGLGFAALMVAATGGGLWREPTSVVFLALLTAAAAFSMARAPSTAEAEGGLDADLPR